MEWRGKNISPIYVNITKVEKKSKEGISWWSSVWGGGHSMGITSVAPISEHDRLVTADQEQMLVWEISSGRILHRGSGCVLLKCQLPVFRPDFNPAKHTMEWALKTAKRNKARCRSPASRRRWHFPLIRACVLVRVSCCADCALRRAERQRRRQHRRAHPFGAARRRVRGRLPAHLAAPGAHQPSGRNDLHQAAVAGRRGLPARLLLGTVGR